VYSADRKGWFQVEGVVVVVCVDVCDEGCEAGIVVYVKDSDRVKQGVG